MCGIVGLMPLSGRRPPSTIGDAIASLHHRGPDGQGVYIDDAVALGHTRLSILDPSDAGAQPMHSSDGRYVIVYNGEIYNFRELRQDLQQRGVTLRGNSDTEVLLESYRLFGLNVLSSLNGIFAFAIADLQSRELLIVRDPMGVKPLYVSEGAFGFAFASEIKALLQIAPIDETIDTVAVQRYLTFLWSAGERTILQAVRKVEPGTAHIVRDGRIVRSWRYYERPSHEPRLLGDWRPHAEALADKIDSAVQRQMVSDAPVGAFLSGGLDSTAIVASARRSAPDIECFTMAVVGDDFGDMASDLPYARLAAKALGVRLTEVPVGPQDVMAGLQRMVWDLDEPLADPACINVRLIALQAREAGIKVLLSGTGADDIFSGYRRHLAAAIGPVWDRVPMVFRRALAGVVRRDGFTRLGLRRVTKMLNGIDLPPDRRLANLFAWTPPNIAASLVGADQSPTASGDGVLDPLLSVLAELTEGSALEKCLELEQRFFLADHNLIYTDKMGMSAGVEVRVPMLDDDLVRFAATIPSAWKLHGTTTKWLFRQSQRGRVPDAILRRAKTGFGVPLREWMRGPLKDMARDLLARDTILRRGLFDLDVVARLQSETDAGRIDGSYTLFSLMCIELWAQQISSRHN
jgi:asparagine synthase (glutamine-hydrolysing)